MKKLLCIVITLIHANSLHSMEAKTPQLSSIVLPQAYFYLADTLSKDVTQHILSLQLGNFNFADFRRKMVQECACSKDYRSYHSTSCHKTPHKLIDDIKILIPSCGHLLAKEILLEYFFKYAKISIFDIRDSLMNTVLHMVSDDKHIEISQFLLDAAGNNAWELLSGQDQYGQTALHKASDDLNIKTIKLFLNTAHENASTLLIMKNNAQSTAFDSAGWLGHTEVAQLLLSFANDDARQFLISESKALYYAVNENHLDMVKFLLNSTDDNGWPLLIQQDYCGNTALHRAAHRGLTVMANVLLDAAHKRSQSFINIKNCEGTTAFDIATPEIKEIMQCYLEKNI